jgi:membrane protein implicated in regulation of membrane protease activity
MRDGDTNGIGDTARRAVLCAISVAVMVGAVLLAPRLGWTTGLGLFAMGTLVLVVILLAMAPDEDAGEGTSDTTP